MAYSYRARRFVVVLDPELYMLVMVTLVLLSRVRRFAKIVPVFIVTPVALSRCKNAFGKSRLPLRVPANMESVLLVCLRSIPAYVPLVGALRVIEAFLLKLNRPDPEEL